MSPAKTKRNPLGSGRNPRVAGELATSMTTLRLTPTERATYEAAATIEGQSLAEWIRAACSDRVKRTKRKAP
ncbi:MAG: hypothetical protein NT062_19590 [Proteobacteria bacterium]|nr:hypothetical protein [Pseudomonadota bacterium]